jgi:hypothetical protein
MITGVTAPSDVEITARVRVDSWAGGASARAGVSLDQTGSGQGYNLVLRDGGVEFLDDAVAWGNYYSFAWQVGTWYWMSLKVEDGVLYGNVWADGAAAPTDWAFVQTGWSDRAPGAPGLNGGSGGATASFDDVTVSVDGSSTLPATPANVAAVPASPSQINLSWSAVDGAANFKIERSEDGSARWTQIAMVPGGVTSYQDTALAAATTYYYRVRAWNSGGDSATSPVVSATTLPASSALFSDDFSGSALGPAWQTVQGNWVQQDGVLSQDALLQQDPQKALIAAATTLSDVQITARVRVDSWTGGASARAGVSLDQNGSGLGYNLLFRDGGVQFLDDYVAWGNYYNFAWQVGTWYWMNLKVEDGVLYGNVWADGTSAPTGWAFVQTGWSDRPPGAPGLNGGSGGATASFDDVTVTARPFQYDPAASPWAYAGSSGIAANGSALTSGNPAAPEGTQVGFFEGGGSISQTVPGMAAGTYALTFDAAQWASAQASQQDFQVLVDGAPFGTFTPPDSNYTLETTDPFTVSAGPHTITFQGLDTAGGDNTALIDAAQLHWVSAPPTVTTPAAASPSPVTGTSTVLSVLGADASYPEADLTYTWTTTSAPAGAPAPSFSQDGTNAARQTTVTFARAGTYTFRVTVAAPDSLTAASSVTVTVSQTVTSVAVSPTAAAVIDTTAQPFTATSVDQFGQASTSPPPLAWSLDAGGAGGTISTAGVYTGPAAGSGGDTVRATSGGAMGAAAVTVYAPPVVSSVPPIETTAGTQFQQTIATFTESLPTSLLDQLTANIVWGDGTSSAGSLDAGNATLALSGSHTYATAGTDIFVVQIVWNRQIIASASSSADIVVPSDTISAQGDSISPVVGQTYSGQVAAFTDSNPSAIADDFWATIDWGDGETSGGTIAPDGNGGFIVSGGYTYAEVGSYNATVTISDDLGGTASAPSTANVNDASLSAHAVSISATASTAFSGIVATFTDGNPYYYEGDFTARIDWGDGTAPTTGFVIPADVSGQFSVSGVHTFADAGSYTVTVAINDRGGSQSVSSAASTVRAAAGQEDGGSLYVYPGPSFVIGPTIDVEDPVYGAITLQWDNSSSAWTGYKTVSYPGWNPFPAFSVAPTSGVTYHFVLYSAGGHYSIEWVGRNPAGHDFAPIPSSPGDTPNCSFSQYLPIRITSNSPFRAVTTIVAFGAASGGPDGAGYIYGDDLDGDPYNSETISFSADTPPVPYLSIDSNNAYGDSTVFPLSSQNGSEDQAGTTGKILAANTGDTNGNGIPDFAEGFGPGGSPQHPTPGARFVPVVLTIPDSVDPDHSLISFDYSGSDPNDVTVTAGDNGPVYTPADGRLRLWTKDGSQDRNGAGVIAGGDYIAPGVAFSPSAIGVASNRRTVTLWVEAVSPKPAFDVDGAADEIKVSIDPDGASGFIQSDAVRVTIAKSVVLFVNLGDSTPPTDPSNPRGLTPADLAAFYQARSAWLATIGTPSVPADATGYADLDSYTTAAESQLQVVRTKASQLASLTNDPVVTNADYLNSLEDATYAYDVYLNDYREAVLVESQFLANQWYLSSANYALMARVDNLPNRIDGLDVAITPDQLNGLGDAVQGVGEQIGNITTRLEYIEGGTRGVGTGIAIGGAFIAGAIWAAPVALGAGAALLGAGISTSLNARWNQGQSAIQIGLGTAADVSGFNSLYVSITGTDYATGQSRPLTPNERGLAFGAGVTSLALTIAAGSSSAGQASQQVTLNVPNPVSWMRAGSFTRTTQLALPGGGAVPLAVPAYIPVAIPIPTELVNVSTVSLGATQLVVYMTAPSNINQGGYGTDDYPDRGDDVQLTEIEPRDTAYEAGEQQGRELLTQQRGLQETNFVNPLEDDGKYGTGFDDVLRDANGDYWIAEYKGGTAELSKGRLPQMSRAWVEDVIARMTEADPDNPWAGILKQALDDGKLHGIAVKTPYLTEMHQQFGDPYLLGEWHY